MGSDSSNNEATPRINIQEDGAQKIKLTSTGTARTTIIPQRRSHTKNLKEEAVKLQESLYTRKRGNSHYLASKRLPDTPYLVK